MHITASDGEVITYMNNNGDRGQKSLQLILERICSCDVVAVSSADIFMTDEIITTALERNPELIMLIETKGASNYYSIKQVPMKVKKVIAEYRSLSLSKGRVI